MRSLTGARTRCSYCACGTIGRFRVAWYFAIVALMALVLPLIIRVSAGAAASVPKVVRPELAAAAPTGAPTRPIDPILIDAADRGDLSAAYRNHVPVAALLIERGADVNLADSRGVTPLARARQRGYRAIVEILTRAGAR